MIYVFEDGSIVYDGSTISDYQKSQAVSITSIPEPDSIEGKYAVLKSNVGENRVYYEYIDISDMDYEKTEFQLLQEKVAQQDKVIQELMFEILPALIGGGM